MVAFLKQHVVRFLINLWGFICEAAVLCEQIAVWWWNQLKATPLAAFTLLAMVAGAILLCVRLLRRKRRYVLLAFDVPQSSSLTGRTVADLVADNLQEIIKVAHREAPTRLMFESLEKGPISSPPSPPSVGIEVGGFSTARLVSELQRICDSHQYLTGNLLLQSNNELELHSRVSGKWSWSSTATTINGAAAKLAENIARDIYPTFLRSYYLKLDKFHDAVLAARRAVELDPTLDNRLRLATALCFDEETNEALDILNALFSGCTLKEAFRWSNLRSFRGLGYFRLNRKRAIIRRGIAGAYYFAGDFDSAIQNAEDSVRRTPKDPDAHAIRGMCQHRAEQYTEALASYEVALKLHYKDRQRLKKLYEQCQSKIDQHPAVETEEQPQTAIATLLN